MPLSSFLTTLNGATADSTYLLFAYFASLAGNQLNSYNRDEGHVPAPAFRVSSRIG
jgi:hypothetical protein